jgi:hypothetical protein
VRLPANAAVLELQRLVYRVDFNVRTAAGERIAVDGGFFEAPATDIDVNLADVLESTGLSSAATLPVYYNLESIASPFGEDLVRSADAEAALELMGAQGSQRVERTVTVGPGGQFETLNEALTYCSRWTPQYLFKATRLYDPVVEIVLKSGYVMAEQVFLVGQNLSYVVITAEDDEVTIRRSAVSQSFGLGSQVTWRTGVFPAFSAHLNSALPIIGCLFEFDTTGTGSGTVGVRLSGNSRGVILKNSGVKAAGWRGIDVESSEVYARGSIWDGSGWVHIPGVSPSGARGGIRLAGSRASIRAASAQNCLYGAYVGGGVASVVDLNCSGAGVYAGEEFDFGAGNDDSESGDEVTTAPTQGSGLVIQNAWVGGAGGYFNDCAKNGVEVRDGSVFYNGRTAYQAGVGYRYLEATGNGERAVLVNTGGTFIAQNCTLSAVGSFSTLSLDNASRAVVSGATITSENSHAVGVSGGSELSAQGATITSDASWGVRMFASRADIRLAAINGTSGGVQLNNGSVILNSQGATTSGGALTVNVVAGTSTADGTHIGFSDNVGAADLDASNWASGSDFEGRHPWTLGTGQAVATDQARSGSKSLKLTGSGTSNIGLYGTNVVGPLQVVPGEQIAVSLWVRRDSAYAATNTRLRLVNVANSNTEQAVNFNEGNIASADTWTNLTATYTVGSGVHLLRASIESTVTAGTVWVDDIVIRKLPAALASAATVGGTAIVSTSGSQVLTNKDLTAGSNIFGTADTDRQSQTMQTLPRFAVASNTGLVSQTVQLVYNTCPESFTATKIEVLSGTTAAAATPSVVQMGIYSVASNGDLTLIASTPNDTALLAATNTLYEKSFSTPVALTAGSRYALALLVVSSATMPTIAGYARTGTGQSTLLAKAPRLLGNIAGQSDLPASIAAGDVANANQMQYLRVSA